MIRLVRAYLNAPLTVAPRRQAVDRQIEAGELVQRAGEDGGALSAGGGIGGGHGLNI
jgi:hypothetical protein